MWSSPHATHSFPRTPTFPFSETATPYHLILLTPPIVPTPTSPAQPMTSPQTSLQTDASIPLSPSHINAIKPLSTPCTCALCLFSCSHGCSVLTPIKGRSHHDLWVPSLPPCQRLLSFTYNLSLHH